MNRTARRDLANHSLTINVIARSGHRSDNNHRPFLGGGTRTLIRKTLPKGLQRPDQFVP
jgi:hypothetical protein